MNMKIFVELISDALPGSGGATTGIVDQDIAFGELGVPYIPAKRFKGILRTSARDLTDWNELYYDTDDIFGKEGSSFTIFKISNGYIENYQLYQNFLRYCRRHPQLSKVFAKQMVKRFFSYNRTQTSLIRTKLVSKEKSLRTSRVLRKELNFHFDLNIIINDELDKLKFKEDLEKICKITKNFGTSRTRGLGEINLVLKEESDHKIQERLTFKSFNDKDLCTLNLTLLNNEHLLVSNLLGGNQSSELFIRGSYILGSLARIYIMQKRLEKAHTDPAFRDIFLSGKVIFTNFYPYSNGKIFYPVPSSIVKEKNKEKYYDLAYEPDIEEIKDIQTIALRGFASIDSSLIQSYFPSTKIESHHRRPKDRKIGHAYGDKNKTVEETGIYFHYNVLEPNQQFKGQIIGKYEYIKNILETIPKESTIHIGKSMTAQYGKCTLNIDSLEFYSTEFQNNLDNHNLIITLISDMILRNEYGYIIPDITILKSQIEKSLGLKIGELEITKSFLKFIKVGGFNSAWKLPKVQGQALGAGSVIILARKDRDKMDLRKIREKFFESRISEGYGQIEINIHGFSKIERQELKNDSEIKVEQKFHKNLSLINSFIEFCITHSLESTLRMKILKTLKNPSFEKLNLSGSFLQRLLLFIDSSENVVLFNDKIKDLKEIQLKKIQSYLFVENNEVKINKFNKFLIDALKEQLNSDFSEDVKIDTIILNRNQEFYKFYFHTFITYLIIKMRGMKK